MDGLDRREQYLRQTEGLYTAIGRFAVKFEHVVHAMQLNIMFILNGAGLRSQELANAALAGLTAEPLRRILGAMLAEVTKSTATDVDRRIIDNILKRVQDLTEQRNDTIHRTWFVGWASAQDENFSKVGSWKFRATNKGAEFRPREATAADFDSLSADADELVALINRLGGSLMLGTSIGNNFVLDQDGQVRMPPGTSPNS